MSEALLATKLYSPRRQPGIVARPHLIERLDQGVHRTLTLISAPAGFGKTTLISEWIDDRKQPAAWLSLDEQDNDPPRFLSYIVAALQTIFFGIGGQTLAVLRSPQPPSPESVLTSLINEIAMVPSDFLLVLDDYHAVDSRAVDQALGFLIEHQPPQMHLVITTREDPHLPLARLRARGQLTEIRASDLRFTSPESAEFLNQSMGLNISEEDILALETRTEGWIAGLQLAAISLQGQDVETDFIRSFTGSHRFVLDYLVEEVLQRQPERIQDFLIGTCILDRLCGPLCDAVLQDNTASARQTLEHLEQINLFVIPLDNERRWYRYHHLFAELLRQRLQQSATATNGTRKFDIPALHIRASEWFESEGLEIEAFHHAIAANDVERAERLIQGNGRPLYVRGGAVPVLNWLESLPRPELDSRPTLWVVFATTLAILGQMTRVEVKLQAAEAAMSNLEHGEHSRDLTGRIADLRALVGLMAADPGQIETIIAQSHRALEYLSAENESGRAATLWKLGLAYQYRGDRDAATQTHIEVISASEASGNTHINILASSCLGHLQELNHQLHTAAQTYERVLRLVGEPPGPVACEAHVGLARIWYEWNDLERAEHHGLLSVRLARQLEISSFISSELFLARLRIAQGDLAGATAILDQTEQDAIARRFLFRLPDIAAMRALAYLRQGDLKTARGLAETHDLPITRARIYLAIGETSAALDALKRAHDTAVAKNWEFERLQALVLQSVALCAHGAENEGLHVLEEALKLAEPGGYIRIFVDEGAPLEHMLSRAAVHGTKPAYVAKLLAALESERVPSENGSHVADVHASQPLIEPLSQRELEVLELIALGLSNREISERLFLALNTVKGHNRVIFSKLQVQRRTEAIARARELGLV